MKRDLVCVSAFAAMIIGIVLALGTVGGYELGVLSTGKFLIGCGVTVVVFWTSTCLFDYARFI